MDRPDKNRIIDSNFNSTHRIPKLALGFVEKLRRPKGCKSYSKKTKIHLVFVAFSFGFDRPIYLVTFSAGSTSKTATWPSSCRFQPTVSFGRLSWPRAHLLVLAEQQDPLGPFQILSERFRTIFPLLALVSAIRLCGFRDFANEGMPISTPVNNIF